MSLLEQIFKKYKTDKYDHYYANLYEEIFSHLRDNKINILEIGVFFGLSHLSWNEYFTKAEIYGIDIFHPHRYSKNMKCFAYRPLDIIEKWDKEKDNKLNKFELREWYKEKVNEFINCERVKIYRCSQSFIDSKTAPRSELVECERGLKWFSEQIPKVEFDIIIDDGSHRQSDHQISLAYLFKKLKSGGIYVIEDAQFEKYNKYNKEKSPMTIDVIDNYIKNGKINTPCINEEDKLYLEHTIKSAKVITCGKRGEKVIVIYKK
jgi:hypothetical protein